MKNHYLFAMDFGVGALLDSSFLWGQKSVRLLIQNYANLIEL